MHPKTAIFVVLAFLIEPQLAVASPPPPIMLGTPEALRTCLAGGVYGVTSSNEVFYTTESPDLPSELAGFAGKGGHFAFRVCQDRDGNTHYFGRFAASNDLPVCEVIEKEMFRDPTGMGKDAMPIVYGSTNYNSDYVRVSGWTAKAPDEWLNRGYPRDTWAPTVTLAQLANSPCPLGDNRNYVHIYNVPPGVFKGIADAIKNDGSLNGTAMRNVRCENVGCSAGLSNGKTVVLDVGEKGITITKVLPYVD